MYLATTVADEGDFRQICCFFPSVVLFFTTLSRKIIYSKCYFLLPEREFKKVSLLKIELSLRLPQLEDKIGHEKRAYV